MRVEQAWLERKLQRSCHFSVNSVIVAMYRRCLNIEKTIGKLEKMMQDTKSKVSSIETTTKAESSNSVGMHKIDGKWICNKCNAQVSANDFYCPECNARLQ